MLTGSREKIVFGVYTNAARQRFQKKKKKKSTLSSDFILCFQ